jgi:hypothetical protein
MYKQLLAALSCIGLSLGPVYAETTDEPCILALLTDLYGTKTYQVVTTNDLPSLKSEAKLDNDAMPKAYRNLRAAWRREHEAANPQPAQPVPNSTGQVFQVRTRIPPYPMKRLPPPREVRQVGVFPTAAAAEERKKVFEDLETARLESMAADQFKAAEASSAPSKYSFKKPSRAPAASHAKPADPAGDKKLIDELIQEIAKVRAESDLQRSATGLKTPENADRRKLGDPVKLQGATLKSNTEFNK